ncbi:MAG: hypothetical protein WCP12_06845 [bacterium]
MMGRAEYRPGRGTRLRALDEQTLDPPEDLQYSKIPAFHYSVF